MQDRQDEELESVHEKHLKKHGVHSLYGESSL